MNYLLPEEIRTLLTNWALRPDSSADLKEIFGADDSRAHSLIEQIKGGDFSWVPTVEVLSSGVLNGTLGAYARSTATIYLSDACAEERVCEVLLEEIGHHIDALFNSNETPGDEGTLFSAAVLGLSLSDAEIESILNEDDSATITLAGKTILVECASDTLGIDTNSALSPASPSTLSSAFKVALLTGSTPYKLTGNANATNQLLANLLDADVSLVAGTATSTTLKGGKFNNWLDASKNPIGGTTLLVSGPGTLLTTLAESVDAGVNSLHVSSTPALQIGQTLNGNGLAYGTKVVAVDRSTLTSVAANNATTLNVASVAGYVIGETLVGPAFATGTTVLDIDLITSSLVLSTGILSALSSGSQIIGDGRILIDIPTLDQISANDTLQPITATNFNGNTLIGGAGKSTLDASQAAGSASLISGTGATTMLGGWGTTTLNGGNILDASRSTGAASLVSGTGDTTMLGGASTNVMDASYSTGNASLIAGSLAGATTMIGGAGHSTLDGSKSSSSLKAVGGLGDNTILGGIGSAWLQGGAGNNLIKSSTDSLAAKNIHTLFGGYENSNNTLIGGAGRDCLYGGNLANNTLISGSTLVAHTLMGQGVSNSLVAGRANDFLFINNTGSYGVGSNTLDGRYLSLVGGIPTESLLSGTSRATLIGSDDKLSDNYLVSGSSSLGAQTLVGHGGNNTLVAGLGHDYLGVWNNNAANNSNNVYLFGQNNITNHTIVLSTVTGAKNILGLDYAAPSMTVASPVSLKSSASSDWCEPPSPQGIDTLKVGSTTGFVNGDLIKGSGIAPGTTIKFKTITTTLNGNVTETPVLDGTITTLLESVAKDSKLLHVSSTDGYEVGALLNTLGSANYSSLNGSAFSSGTWINAISIDTTTVDESVASGSYTLGVDATTAKSFVVGETISFAGDTISASLPAGTKIVAIDRSTLLENTAANSSTLHVGSIAGFINGETISGTGIAAGTTFVGATLDSTTLLESATVGSTVLHTATTGGFVVGESLSSGGTVTSILQDSTKLSTIAVSGTKQLSVASSASFAAGETLSGTNIRSGTTVMAVDRSTLLDSIASGSTTLHVANAGGFVVGESLIGVGRRVVSIDTLGGILALSGGTTSSIKSGTQISGQGYLSLSAGTSGAIASGAAITGSGYQISLNSPSVSLASGSAVTGGGILSLSGGTTSTIASGNQVVGQGYLSLSNSLQSAITPEDILNGVSITGGGYLSISNSLLTNTLASSSFTTLGGGAYLPNSIAGGASITLSNSIVDNIEVGTSLSAVPIHTTVTNPLVSGGAYAAGIKVLQVGSTYGLAKGDTISGTGITNGTAIANIDTLNSKITLSSALTSSMASGSVITVHAINVLDSDLGYFRGGGTLSQINNYGPGSASMELGSNANRLKVGTIVAGASGDIVTELSSYSQSLSLNGGSGGDLLAVNNFQQLLNGTYNGNAGDDTVQINTSSTLNDSVNWKGVVTSTLKGTAAATLTSDFITEVEALQLSDSIGSSNMITLGTNATGLGFVSVYGGQGRDTIAQVAGAGNFYINTGSNNDLIQIVNTTYLAGDTINGGLGTDTLQIGIPINSSTLSSSTLTTALSDGSFSKTSGIEVLSINGGTSVTFDSVNATYDQSYGSASITLGQNAYNAGIHNIMDTLTPALGKVATPGYVFGADGGNTITQASTFGRNSFLTDSVNSGATSLTLASASGWSVGDLVQGSGITSVTRIVKVDTLTSSISLSAATTGTMASGSQIYELGSVNMRGGLGKDLFILASSNLHESISGYSYAELSSPSLLTQDTLNTVRINDQATLTNDSFFKYLCGIQTIDLRNSAGNFVFLDSLDAEKDLYHKGVSTIIAGAGNDTIDAWGYTNSVTINANAAKSGNGVYPADSLRGSSLKGSEFLFSETQALGASTVRGGTGLDTVALTGLASLRDQAFSNLSGIDVISLQAGGSIQLGSQAQSANIRSLYGGAGNDTFFHTTADTQAVYMNGGNGSNVYFEYSTALLSKDTIVGGTGGDLLIVNDKFSNGSFSNLANAATINSRVLTLASNEGFVVGDGASGYGIAKGTTITGVDRSSLLSSASSGATTLLLASTAGFKIGETLNGSGLAYGTSIVSISGGSVTLSAALTDSMASGSNIFGQLVTLSSGITSSLAAGIQVIDSGSQLKNVVSVEQLSLSGTAFVAINDFSSLSGIRSLLGGFGDSTLINSNNNSYLRSGQGNAYLQAGQLGDYAYGVGKSAYITLNGGGTGNNTSAQLFTNTLVSYGNDNSLISGPNGDNVQVWGLSNSLLAGNGDNLNIYNTGAYIDMAVNNSLTFADGTINGAKISNAVDNFTSSSIIGGNSTDTLNFIQSVTLNDTFGNIRLGGMGGLVLNGSGNSNVTLGQSGDFVGLATIVAANGQGNVTVDGSAYVTRQLNYDLRQLDKSDALHLEPSHNNKSSNSLVGSQVLFDQYNGTRFLFNNTYALNHDTLGGDGVGGNTLVGNILTSSKGVLSGIDSLVYTQNTLAAGYVTFWDSLYSASRLKNIDYLSAAADYRLIDGSLIGHNMEFGNNFQSTGITTIAGGNTGDNFFIYNSLIGANSTVASGVSSVTNNVAAGSNVITLASATNFSVGDYLMGSGITNPTCILAIDAVNSVLTLSSGTSQALRAGQSLYDVTYDLKAGSTLSASALKGQYSIAVGSVSNFKIGDFIRGSGIDPSSTITGVDSASKTISLSKALTYDMALGSGAFDIAPALTGARFQGGSQGDKFYLDGNYLNSNYASLGASINPIADKFTLDGGASNNTLIFTKSGITLSDSSSTSDFANLKNMQGIWFDTVQTGVNASTNQITLDKYATLSGLASVVGGNGNSLGQGDTFIQNGNFSNSFSLVGGSGDDLFKLSGISLLGGVSTGSTLTPVGNDYYISGGAGTDTLWFYDNSSKNTSSKTNNIVMTDAMFSNIQKMEALTLGGGSSLEGAHSVTMGLNASLSGIRTILGSYLRDSIYPNDGSTIASSLGDTFTQTSANNVGLNITGNVGADYFSVVNASLLGQDTINGVANKGNITMTSGSTVTGAAPMDTLAITSSSQALQDIHFKNITLNGNGALVLTDTYNTATIELDSLAAAAGIKNITGSTNSNSVDGAFGLIAKIGAGDTLTSTIVGGESSDSISVNTRTQFGQNTYSLSGGTDTLSVVNGGGTYSDTDFSKIKGVEILSLGGTTNINASLGAIASLSGITQVYGGDGFNSLTQLSSFTNSLKLVGGDAGNSFVIANSTLLGNDTIFGGLGIDSLTLTTDSQTIGDGAFAYSQMYSIEALKTANGANSIVAGTRAESEGLVSVVGGTGADTIKASAYSTAITISGGGGADSLLTGSGNDLIVFATGTDLTAVATLNGGSGNDTVAVSTDAQTIGDAAFAKLSSIEVFKTANGANNITFGTQAQDAGIASIFGGTGADTINASAFNNNLIITGNGGADSILSGSGNDLFNYVSLADMILAASISGGKGTNTLSLSGDAAVSATIGDAAFAKLSSIQVFKTADGSNVLSIGSLATQAGINTVIGGGGTDLFNVSGAFLNDSFTSIVGGQSTDTVTVSTDSQTFDNAAFTRLSSIEVFQTGNGSNSLAISTGATTAGISTVIGGSGADTIDASTRTSSITINGNGGADYLYAGTGNDRFVFAQATDLNAASLISGSTGTDTVALTTSNNSQIVTDASFLKLSSIQVFQTGSGTNSITMAANASAAGISTVVGGASADTIIATALTSGITINGNGGADSLLAGTGNDQFLFSTASNLSAASTVSGNTGTDTVALTTDSQTVADSAFSKLSLIDIFQTANGNNIVTLGSAAASAGINSVVGGVGSDKFVASTTFFSNTSTASLLGGDGYSIDTLTLSTDAQTISDSAYAKLSSIEVLQTANGANSITLAALAVAEGISTVVGGSANDTINGTALTSAITINGNGGADSLLAGTGNDQFVFTTAANLTLAAAVSGNTGTDTVALTNDAQAVADTSFAKLSSIEVFQTANGANAVTLSSGATTAGINTLSGGSGNDSFNVSSTFFSNSSTASLLGGLGIDTLTLSTDAQTIGSAAFAKLSSIDVFQTGNGANSMTMDTLASTAGISTIIGGTAADTIIATALTSGITINGNGGADSLLAGTGNDQFLFSTASNLTAASLVSGNTGTDTVALTADSQTVADNAFAKLSSIEVFQTANGTNAVTLASVAKTAGISTLSGGSGNDSFNVSSAFFSNTSTASLQGGLGIDTLTLSTDAQTIGDAAFTKLSSIEFLQAANGANSITLATNATAAGINSLSGGTGNDSFNVSSTYFSNTSTASLLGGSAGIDTLTLSTDAQTIGDTAFSKLNHIQVLQTANGSNSIVLASNAIIAGIKSAIGGSENDNLNANAYNSSVTLDGGGSAIISDTLTGGNGLNSDRFILGNAGATSTYYGTSSTGTDNYVIVTSLASDSLVNGANNSDKLQLNQSDYNNGKYSLGNSAGDKARTTTHFGLYDNGMFVGDITTSGFSVSADISGQTEFLKAVNNHVTYV
jgi:Ca2+-binding RTX toxin-like protein